MAMSRDAALEVLARRRREELVVSTMSAVRPWERLSPSARNLVCIGFMGGAATLGLGVALARPDLPVWVLDGDGSLLMQLGSLATIAEAAPPRFLHVVLHNGVYELSGGQRIPAEGQLSFAGLAREAGYTEALRVDDLEQFDAQIDALLTARGPVLLELMTRPEGDFYQPPSPPQRPEPAPLALNWPCVAEALHRA